MLLTPLKLLLRYSRYFLFINLEIQDGCSEVMRYFVKRKKERKKERNKERKQEKSYFPFFVQARSRARELSSNLNLLKSVLRVGEGSCSSFDQTMSGQP